MLTTKATKKNTFIWSHRFYENEVQKSLLKVLAITNT